MRNQEGKVKQQTMKNYKIQMEKVMTKIYKSENKGYSYCSALHTHVLTATFTSLCGITETRYTQVRKGTDMAIVTRNFPITTFRSQDCACYTAHYTELQSR